MSKKMQIFCCPGFLKKLNAQERTLISRTTLLKKVTIILKGRFLKLKGSFCNIPIKSLSIINALSHSADNGGLKMVKLKRKLNFRGQVYFEPVYPEEMSKEQLYLKK